MALMDLFHTLKVGAPLFSNAQVTASGAIGNVLDRRDLDDPDGLLVGFILHTDLVAAADGSNYLQIEIYEADEKTNPTTLTSGTLVADADLLGFTADGVRSVSANPDYDSTQPEGVREPDPNIQNGFLPLINATTLVDMAFFFAYRGYSNCVQVYANETGIADATFTCIPVYMSRAGATQNLVNPPDYNP